MHNDTVADVAPMTTTEILAESLMSCYMNLISSDVIVWYSPYPLVGTRASES